MDEIQTAFIIEEYKLLKEELSALVKEVRLLETASIAGAAGIYAWLSKTPDIDKIVNIGWWIPVLFPVFGALRQFALLRRIMHIAEYIRSVEYEMCRVYPFGWEYFLAKKRKTPSGVAISITAVLFWLALLFITLFVGKKFGA